MFLRSSIQAGCELGELGEEGCEFLGDVMSYGGCLKSIQTPPMTQFRKSNHSSLCIGTKIGGLTFMIKTVKTHPFFWPQV